MTSENPNTQVEEQDIQLPPDTELVGVYTSVTQANIKDEQKVTTPKALTDGLIAPAEEFEGRVEYQRPWDTEFTEEVGGKYEPFVMPSLSRAHTAFAEKAMPAIAIGDDAKSRKWLEVVNKGLRSTTYNGMYQDEVRTSEAPFSNDVEFRGRKLNPRHVTWAPLGNEKLEGSRSAVRTMTTLGLTALTQVALWSSGIWVTFRAASDLDYVRFNQSLTEMNYNLGRATYGLAFSALTGLTTSKIVDFLIEFIFETTIDIDLTQFEPTDANHPLRKLIHSEDIPVMIAAFMESRFPKGYPYERACLDNPGKSNCVIKRTFNLKELIINRTSTLDNNHFMFMCDRRSRVRTMDEVLNYQKTLINNEAKRYNVGMFNGYEIFITVKSVNIADMEASTNSWIGSLVSSVEKLVSEDTNMTKRNQLLNQMSLASIARQYTHYISQIDIGHAVMDEKEAIEEQLSVFSAHDEIRKKIMEAVVTHLEKNVISIVAAPVLQCDNCGKSTKDEATKTNFTNAVPLDTIQLFFVLFLQILMQLKDR